MAAHPFKRRFLSWRCNVYIRQSYWFQDSIKVRVNKNPVVKPSIRVRWRENTTLQNATGFRSRVLRCMDTTQISGSKRVFEKGEKDRRLVMPITIKTEKLYDTDLTDVAWTLTAPMLPAGLPGGRPRP
jgi:hypothetical protein